MIFWLVISIAAFAAPKVACCAQRLHSIFPALGSLVVLLTFEYYLLVPLRAGFSFGILRGSFAFS